jgi:hypothetical protein
VAGRSQSTAQAERTYPARRLVVIALGGDSLKAVITAGLAQGLEFIQRTQLAAPGRRIYNIFGERRWITKYPQIRIALRLIVAGLVGIRRDIRSLDYRDRPEVMAAEAPDLQSFK